MRRCHLGSSEVLVAIVHRLELTAIDGHDRLREQIQSAAQHDKLATYVADRWAVVLAEVGNGLEVRHQTSSQPHELDVALRLALQTAARLNAIEITVDVNLQQRRGVVRRTARCRPIDAFKSERRKIELVNKDLHYTDRVVLGDVVI